MSEIAYNVLRKQLSEYDIISFDIFDTLITRCVVKPADIFLLIEAATKKDHFASDRQQAEQLAYQQYGEKTNFQTIYTVLQNEFGYTQDECSGLMANEFEMELRLVIPRHDMLKLVQELQAEGKRILLCSDMYLCSSQIRQLLTRCGYPEDLEIWVSCEKGASKHSGRLWQQVFDYLPAGKKTIHVGDNEWSDYKRLKQLEKEAILIDSGMAAFEKSELYPYLSGYLTEDVGCTLVMGHLINKACFNSPFETKSSEQDAVAIWLGYPFACFMDWLVQQRDNSLLLFVTREGYLLEPLYERYCQKMGVSEQDHAIFHASRAACLAATICSEQDVSDAMMPAYSGTVGHFVKNRLNFEIQNDKLAESKIELPAQKEKLKSMLLPYIPDIVQNGIAQRDAYLKYIHQVRHNPNQKMTVVDIGYAGTIQYALSKIIDKPVCGKYLYYNGKAALSGTREFTQCVRDINDGQVHPIYDNTLFLEAAMQVPYGQLQKMDFVDGIVTPGFNSDASFSEYIPIAQEQYIQFAEWVAQWKRQLGEKMVLYFELAEAIWACMIKFDYLPEALLTSFWLADDYIGTPMWKYDPLTQTWNGSDQHVPMVFTVPRSGTKIGIKYRIKNLVKKIIPQIFYESARQIWIKYIK